MALRSRSAEVINPVADARLLDHLLASPPSSNPWPLSKNLRAIPTSECSRGTTGAWTLSGTRTTASRLRRLKHPSQTSSTRTPSGQTITLVYSWGSSSSCPIPAPPHVSLCHFLLRLSPCHPFHSLPPTSSLLPTPVNHYTLSHLLHRQTHKASLLLLLLHHQTINQSNRPGVYSSLHHGSHPYARVLSREEPPSPRASYNCPSVDPDEYIKDPPAMPPHLGFALLNKVPKK